MSNTGVAKPTTTVLYGGTIVDGSGAEPYLGDVVIAADRIVEIVPARQGNRGLSHVDGGEVIDVRGHLVTPGFIDIHTHSDVSLIMDGRGESKVLQGVTTEVVGNCGFSAFPFVERFRDEQVNLLAGIGDAPGEVGWADLNGYADALHAEGIALNVAALVGHGHLRLAVMGADERQPNPAELQTMSELLAEQLRQGAFGLSTGLTYVPSRFADFAELVELCAVLQRWDALYATHSRGTGIGSVTEAIALAETGVKVQYSHLAINEPPQWGTAAELLSHFERARDAGIDITADVYPYDASASALTQYLPAWVQEGGIAALQERLADAETFARAEAELARGWGDGGVIGWMWDRVVLSRGDGLCGVVDGESIEDAAHRLGRTPAGLVLDLCRQGGNRPQVILFYRLEEDMVEFLSRPYTLVGSDGQALPLSLGDRRPHPRAYGTHARVLGRYVRQTSALALTDAVHRMSLAVAQRLGISDRGEIRPGAVADLAVIDPEQVIDQATFVQPTQPPRGIPFVICAGEMVVREGRQTDARPGRVLRHGSAQSWIRTQNRQPS